MSRSFTGGEQRRREAEAEVWRRLEDIYPDLGINPDYVMPGIPVRADILLALLRMAEEARMYRIVSP